MSRARCLLVAILSGTCACSADSLRSSVGGINVDANAGSDTSGDGSSARPYRTITRGLAAAHPDATVTVAAGQYGAGETFPITIPSNVTVQAASTAELSGSGAYWSPSLETTVSVAIVATQGSRLSSLRVRAPGGVAVWSEQGGAPAELFANELVDSDYGVVFAGTAQTSLTSNLVSGHANVGIEIVGHAAPVLRRNEVTSNLVGVAIRDRALPDLGAAGDPGVNRFAGNTGCDVANETTNVIEARGNTWDENKYLFAAVTSCAGGAEVVNVFPDSGAVLYQDVPPGSEPIFAGAAPIGSLAPSAGDLLGTATPDLAWTRTGSLLVIAGIFTEPIAVTGGRITNSAAMIWAWHTGLGTGREGAVALEDGVSPLGGSLEHVGPAVPLQLGRTYYWAVWAWDDNGTRIVAASPLSYFTLLN